MSRGETSAPTWWASVLTGVLLPKSYLQTFIQYNSTTHQVATNVRFALLSTSSNGLYVVYNTNAVTVDYIDPHDTDRTTLGRALLIKYSYRFNF